MIRFIGNISAFLNWLWFSRHRRRCDELGYFCGFFSDFPLIFDDVCPWHSPEQGTLATAVGAAYSPGEFSGSHGEWASGFREDWMLLQTRKIREEIFFRPFQCPLPDSLRPLGQ